MSLLDRLRIPGWGKPQTHPSEPPRALREAMAREELSGLATMFRARFIALGSLCVWLAATIPLERSSQYIAALGAFALLGAPPYILALRDVRQTWITAVFLLIDAALLTYLLIVPAPFNFDEWTAQLNLRLPNFLYLGVFLVGVSLCYSPALVLWTGCAVTLAWAAGYLWVAASPESVVHTSQGLLSADLTPQQIISGFLDPRSVSLTRLTNQVAFLVLVTGILTLGVWRSRALVRRQVAAEAERGALSRYFSPNIVADLASADDAFGPPSRQPAAILFADMAGFTSLSERLPPDALFALLREFHARLARIVFAHDGTIDKYVGDAVMAHFGTPQPREDDPVRALRCAGAMIAGIESWNAELIEAGLEPVRLGIGLHFGEVLVGNIGDERRLEYTALGDTVNVAQRLERLTRRLGVTLVVGRSLIDEVRRLGSDPGRVLPGITPGEPQLIRGRSEPVEVWTAAGASVRDAARSRLSEL